MEDRYVVQTRDDDTGYFITLWKSVKNPLPNTDLTKREAIGQLLEKRFGRRWLQFFHIYPMIGGNGKFRKFQRITIYKTPKENRENDVMIE